MVNKTKQVLSVAALALVVLAVFVSPTLAQTEAEALIRFVHAIPGAASIDIYANNSLAFAGVSSGSVTPQITVPAGDYNLTVRQAGMETVLWEQTVSAAPNSAQTLIAATTQPLTFQVFQDDLAPLTLGKARFTAIHAIPAGPAIDVVLSDGRPVVAGLTFGQIYGTLDVPAQSYDFAVVPSGGSIDAAIIPTDSYALNSGTSYIMLVYGTAQRPQVMLLGAAGAPEGSAGYLRVVHAFPGAGPVDVIINGTLAATRLEYGADATKFAALPPGDYDVVYREAGTENEVASTSVSLGENQYTTVAVFPAEGAVATTTFTTDVSAISERQSVINVANLLPADATAALSLNNGTPLSSEVAGGATSSSIVEPADSGATVSVTEGGNTLDLALLLDSIYGGVYYDVLIVPAADGPEAIVLAPVSIAQSIASAPGETVEVVAAPTEVVTDEAPTSEVVTEPTEAVPAEVAPTEAAPTVEAATPTPAPPTPVPPTPTPVPTQGPPVARVLLDPGANLQMRQYPDSSALSLALAPSGSTLTVIGREGAPAVLPFQTPDPEATEWVDPVSLLGQGEQLDRLSTWLFVSYEPEAGGQVDAWINSYYVSVNRENGDLVPLRTLPTVPGNRAGETFNTVVGVPTIDEPVPLAIVGGLDEDVNLQIRRTPDVEGESLTLVANGTALELVGMNEQRSWAFVRYETETGSVTGWANALFLVEYSYQDETLGFSDLEDRNLIETIDESQRGTEAGEIEATGDESTAEAASESFEDVVAGEVLLNEGANLQLRRNPNAQAESLGLIPAGERVVITGRTEDGAWLQTTYEGNQGWVASAYMGLSFNGQPYNVVRLPVIGGTAGPTATLDPDATQEPTPEPTAVPTVAEINTDTVGMMIEPGGSGEGMPVLTRGRQVYFYYNSPDGLFSLIELIEDGTTGWVPANSLFFR
jgi:uncharacterized protein YgiM (DUF1202 family)